MNWTVCRVTFEDFGTFLGETLTGLELSMQSRPGWRRSFLWFHAPADDSDKESWSGPICRGRLAPFSCSKAAPHQPVAPLVHSNLHSLN
jgi:hypothetical protein